MSETQPQAEEAPVDPSRHALSDLEDELRAAEAVAETLRKRIMEVAHEAHSRMTTSLRYISDPGDGPRRGPSSVEVLGR